MQIFELPMTPARLFRLIGKGASDLGGNTGSRK